MRGLILLILLVLVGCDLNIPDRVKGTAGMGPGEQAASRTDQGSRGQSGKSSGSQGGGAVKVNQATVGNLAFGAGAATDGSGLAAPHTVNSDSGLGAPNTAQNNATRSISSAGGNAQSPAGPSLSYEQLNAPRPPDNSLDAISSAAAAPTISRRQPGDPTGPTPGTSDRYGVTAGQDATEQAKEDAYNSASDAIQNRGLGDWLGDHALDLVPGFHQVVPDPNVPSSYADGTYHDGWSPVAALAGMAGMAAPVPGASAVTGFLGQQISDAIGAPDYTFGAQGGWNTSKPSAGSPASTVNDGSQVASTSNQQSGPVPGGNGGIGSPANTQTGSNRGIGDFATVANPQPVTISPTPKSYQNLTTYKSDGSAPTTARTAIF